MNDDALLVLPCGTYGHLQVLQCLLAHAIAACLAHFQYSNQLGLELDAIAKETSGIIAICLGILWKNANQSQVYPVCVCVCVMVCVCVSVGKTNKRFE